MQFGEISFENIWIEKKVSFLDYIFGGCEMSLHLGIDFTASNGRVNEETSLHYLSNGSLNQYQ